MPETIGAIATPDRPSAAATGHAVQRERRFEPRVSADSIPAVIRLDSVSMPAEILNISTSGIRLRVGTPMAIGQELTLSFDHTIAIGRIRNCREEHSSGPFQVGLQLEEVLNLA